MKTYRVYFMDDIGSNQKLLSANSIRDVVDYMLDIGYEPYRIEEV